MTRTQFTLHPYSPTLQTNTNRRRDETSEEAGTVNLEALAKEARARAAVATALAASPPTVEEDEGVRTC